MKKTEERQYTTSINVAIQVSMSLSYQIMEELVIPLKTGV